MSSIEKTVLRSLRRITRAIDMHSRFLASTFGLTGPQLICLRALEELGQTTASTLAREVSLSQSTITGILDRLAARQLVSRDRSEVDRRQAKLVITEAGTALTREAPSSLQERFVERLGRLPPEEQRRIADGLAQVVDMMEAEELDSAPMLATAPLLDNLEAGLLAQGPVSQKPDAGKLGRQ